MNYLSAHVRGEVGGKEQSHLRHILGCTAATQRNLLVPALFYLFGQGVGHFGNDEAGSNGVGTDAARPISLAMDFASPIIPAFEAE